jgi:uncharacterized protein
MDKTVMAALAVIAAAALVILFLHPATGAGNGQAATTTTTPQPGTVTPNHGNAATQTFTLGVSGDRYTPSEIRVKLGTKVRIEGDISTLTGCMTTVNIDGYGISKLMTAGDNVIEFTADKAGTFPIHCNMGMGDGRLVVEG